MDTFKPMDKVMLVYFILLRGPTVTLPMEFMGQAVQNPAVMELRAERDGCALLHCFYVFRHNGPLEK